MNLILILSLLLAWLAILAGAWLAWQLLRQNGRLLLRLEELEQRLNGLEFGDGEEPRGLPVGTAAPEFELADLAGELRSLAGFRGQPLLLVFFNPDCGFCREMMPKLAALCGVRRQAERDPALVAEGQAVRRIQSTVTAGAVQNVGDHSSDAQALVLVITTGDAEKNRQFFAGHQVGCPVLRQNDGEVAKAYQANGTPSGYLISADGTIASNLALGAEALLALATEPGSSRREEAPSDQSGIRNPKSEIDQSLVTSAATSRFGNRSLARSKIKRDGLKPGTPAPDFSLPRLDRRGELSLEEMRGKRVLLVFSSPHCGPCNTLAPQLQVFHRAHPQIHVVMISKGEPKENRAKVKEHGLTFPVVLQRQWEISRRYAMFATPIAYLIDESGVITHDVAVGSDSILTLMSRAERMVDDTHEVALA